MRQIRNVRFPAAIPVCDDGFRFCQSRPGFRGATGPVRNHIGAVILSVRNRIVVLMGPFITSFSQLVNHFRACHQSHIAYIFGPTYRPVDGRRYRAGADYFVARVHPARSAISRPFPLADPHNGRRNLRTREISGTHPICDTWRLPHVSMATSWLRCTGYR